MAHGRLQVNFRARWYAKHQIISSIEIVFSPLFGKTSGTSCYCKSQVQGVQRHRPCELPAEFWKLKKLSTEEKMADRGQSYPRVTEPGSGAREGGASPELPVQGITTPGGGAGACRRMWLLRKEEQGKPIREPPTRPRFYLAESSGKERTDLWARGPLPLPMEDVCLFPGRHPPSSGLSVVHVGGCKP